MSGVRAAIVGDMLWARGEGLNAELHWLLAPIADGPVFQLATDGRLTPFGASVPTERLPVVDWKPLNEILQPVLPSPRMAAIQIPRVPLVLERTTVEQEAVLLLTDWSVFRDWALTAPEVRLRHCRFAVRRGLSEPSSDVKSSLCRVVIKGQPLPPLIGERFWLAGSVGTPLGFQWTPAVDIKTVESVLTRRHAETSPRLHLWRADQNHVEEILSTEWVPVTRANVRATDSEIGGTVSAPL